MKTMKVLFTGGSGILGSEFKRLRPDIIYPTTSEFDVQDYSQMDRFVRKQGCDLLIHAGAFISPPVIDKNPLRAVEVNIVGTANIVKLCMKYHSRLVYISTDYVFDGEKGNYDESAPVNPVNKYAWSKLGGECSVRLYDKALIVRTSFGPSPFPFPKAFSDQWTSREPVAVIARKIVALLDKEVNGVVHVGGPRRTVFEYARSLDPSKTIAYMSIKDVPFKVPVDTSLNCNYYNMIMVGERS